MKNKLNKYRFLVLIYYLVWFAVAVSMVLNIDYVEGDDASTILFHLMGRNPEIQNPYSAYHSGADFFLSLLPSDEQVLLEVSVWSSFIFGFLGMYLLFLWISGFDELSKSTKVFIGLALPFVIPEMLFQSLLYNPTNIGFAFCIISLLLFDKYIKSRIHFYLMLIPIPMFLAAPFRWPLIAFLATLFAYYIYRRKDVSWKVGRNDMLIISVLSLCVVTSIIGIWISGYSLTDLVNVFFWGKEYMSEKELSISVLIATGLSFFTPAVLVLLPMGILIPKQRIMKKVLLILIASIPFFILGFHTSLKFLITLLPIIIMIAAYGIEWCLKRNWSLVVLSILILAPWFIGVKVYTNKFAYGPGFELAQWSPKQKSIATNKISKNPDSRITNMSYDLTFQAGFLMPTLEGPRPLYGYGSCLFNGEWFDVISENSLEREQLLEAMNKRNIKTLFQDRRHSPFQCYLFRQGFECNMPWKNLDKNFKYRLYTKGQEEIRIVTPNTFVDPTEILDELVLVEDHFGLYMSYSSEAQFLEGYRELERIGPYSLLR